MEETNMIDYTKTPTRQDILDYLIKLYPSYYSNEDYPTKTFLINNDVKCDCTDCGGDDSVASCKIEEKYYNLIKNPTIYI